MINVGFFLRFFVNRAPGAEYFSLCCKQSQSFSLVLNVSVMAFLAAVHGNDILSAWSVLSSFACKL